VGGLVGRAGSAEDRRIGRASPIRSAVNRCHVAAGFAASWVGYGTVPREAPTDQEPRVELHLPVGSDAPSLARARVAAEIDLPASTSHVLSLLTSELVSNAVQHAGMGPDQDVIVKLVQDGRVRVEVTDEGPGFDQKTAGLGLQLVGQLAATWGVQADDGRYTVWFELDANRGG
jgi:signal transduction histidine kinase